MKKMIAWVAMVALAGCTTDVNIYGNNNHVNYDPAQYAGQGATVDVLKGMSLPSLSLGGGEKAQDQIEETKDPRGTNGTDVTKQDGVKAVVETSTASVTEDKVMVK